MHEDLWDSGRGSVMLHVLINDLGLIASAARILQERWTHLPEVQRDELLVMIDRSVERGIEHLRVLALTGAS